MKTPDEIKKGLECCTPRWVEYADPLTPTEISEYDLISAPVEK